MAQANTLNLSKAASSGGLTYQAPSLSGQIQNQLFTGFGLIKPAYADSSTPDNTLNYNQAVNSGGLTVQQPNTPRPTGGGGGGGGGPTPTGLDPHINPATGAWDDNFFASQRSAAQDSNSALLSSLNTEYDRNAENLSGQLDFLGTQKGNSLSELDTAFTGTENQVKSAKTNSDTGTADAIKQAGSIAQSTQLQNRNILRALGILNSSAGGELLSKPITEFDKQRASLVASHLQRISELDDTLNQASSQHSNAVKSLEDNYSNLVGQIQTDLRFNDRQRADAIKSANAALNQRMADIQTSMANYKAQVDAAKVAAGQAISSISNYAQPTANTGAISNTLINPGINSNGSKTELSAFQKKQAPNSLNVTPSLLSGGGLSF